ncbi:MAG: DNA helicase PcrA [Chloroflexota bacterium]
MNLIEQLNPAQREAVLHTEGPVLILAGAGSGKTRALTYRIAHLIIDKGVDPQRILAITFTNKAANEMKERVEGLIGPVARSMWVSTFHSMCVRILRRDIGALGYSRSFVIYDDADQATVVKQCVKELNWDEKRYPPAAVLSAISGAKNKLLDPDAFSRGARDYYSDRIAQVYRLYQKKLTANNALDFDDLIMLTVRLFREHPEVLAQYQERFQYIHVDEYQDTNHSQYMLVSLLAAKHRNLCVVGDDDQSIYAWRGADVRNILEFERDYKETKVIKLEQNYRSTKRILAAANEIVRNNPSRKEKDLWTENEEGEPITAFQAADEYAEAEFVAREVERLMRDGRQYRDFAVLYRTNAQSRVFEESFMRHGLPYRIVGGVKFYERKEIKDILAYLRLLVDPADTVSFGRVVNVPKRGVGAATVQRLLDYAGVYNVTPLDAIEVIDQIEGITGKARRELVAFGQALAGWRRDSGELPVHELLWKVVEGSGYLGELLADNSVESQTRVENLKEFYNVAVDFDNASDDTSLEAFLATVSLVTDLDRVDETADAVILMTLHSAKGLEFPVVFLAGLEEGIFPHSRSVNDDSGIEEERRLCYVGVTRAQQRLYLTWASSRTVFGSISHGVASRFLHEIPPELLRGSVPGREAARPPREFHFADDYGDYSGQPRQRSFGRREEAPPPRAAISWREAQTPRKVDPTDAPVETFNPGDRVSHGKFGLGTVVSVRGTGDEAVLKIAFPGIGIKELVSKYAGLRRAD